ncbi:MAG: hypothetical protein AAF612_08520 [Planctomycetota bacterium]
MTDAESTKPSGATPLGLPTPAGALQAVALVLAVGLPVAWWGLPLGGWYSWQERGVEAGLLAGLAAALGAVPLALARRASAETRFAVGGLGSVLVRIVASALFLGLWVVWQPEPERRKAGMLALAWYAALWLADLAVIWRSRPPRPPETR